MLNGDTPQIDIGEHCSTLMTVIFMDIAGAMS